MKLDRRAFLGGTAALATTAAVGCAPAAGFKGIPPASAGFAAGPVEIIDDSAGIPHIRAASKADAFYGQGYVVARDRLFQLDLGHRRNMGRLAEAFGPAFMVHDHAERLFHYRGDLDAELAALPAEVLACARGYCAGINARLDEVAGDPSLLPAEYRILGSTPLRWDVRDFVLARGASIGNVDDEIRRAGLAALGRLDLDALVAPLRPAWTLRVPAGLDVAAISRADLGILGEAAVPLPFGTTPSPVRDPAAPRSEAGSNAWTIAPQRSATGRPILANDPHLGIGGAAPRHVAHLSAPGLDVIGGGAPGLPGIMQGHTDRFAFGRTNSHNDQTDLFILALDPADPERYRHAGGWKRFETVEELIPVKGDAPRRVVIRYSVHGPVLRHDPAAGRATAMSSITMLPGCMGSFAMIAINLAHDWASLAQAFRWHPSPTNFHYADTDGNHGWQVIGIAPLRSGGHDGLLPAPGDGRFDWRGRIDARQLPRALNPAKGWFASANQNNLPDDYPMQARPLAFSFREPYRYECIASVLSAQPRHSLADSAALQQDFVSTPARELVALLPATPSAAAKPAAVLLRGWDGVLGPESGAAALFRILWADLGRRVLEAVVPTEARALVPSIAAGELIRLLGSPDARFGADPAAVRDRLFDASLAAAWDEAVKLMGADPAAWRWDTLHKVRISHPLARLPEIAAAFPAIEGSGSGGDNFTVNARWVPRRGYGVSGGAGSLQDIDVGNWDASVYLNLPGQSADPKSPHHADHYAPWISGAMQPLPFSKPAVDAAARRRTVLVPKVPA
ncbi:penicillin amidase [Polymorphobacter multimanifer]|uniref:penicillin acylase family protein n=1 Tax=Polymorphobacter multimanifer TaxID=1070431 RepID=UPI00166E25EB|nr:penicillin acylase family protein [Polymorphobacter multimanifer]GGI88380.1 penicillin amidase [Polymorphobacter multimanifer]